jgi:hypothetical protein
MAEAKINESCMIGMPTCGYAFNSSRMAFIAAPSDDEFALELTILESLLKEKEYELYIALQRVEPGKFAFCTKICSKIITAQFCIVLLNASSHEKYPKIKIPNPNVHMEYGLMMGFKKYVLPFQREGDVLAFNISPLDTIMYTKGSFKELANSSIDNAIIQTGTTSRPTRALTSSENLIKYIAIRGLRVAMLNSDEANYLYNLGKPFGYWLLDGEDIVYFGIFDVEPAKEVVFRVKLLLQALHEAKQRFETIVSKSMTPDQINQARQTWSRIKIEVVISPEIDKEKVTTKVKELTRNYETVPWVLLSDTDISSFIDKAYADIGEI